MSWLVVAGTGAVLAVLALLLWPRVRPLIDRESGWANQWLLVALAAAAGAGAAAVADSVATLVAFAGLGLGCAVLVVVDLACHRLPDAVTVPTAAVLLAGLVVGAAAGDEWPALLRAVLGGAVLGIGFLLLALASPRAIGLGDVKLAALLGVFLGWLSWTAVLAGVVAAFVLGGLVALLLMAVGRATRSTALAFGPWLVVGTALAAWFVSAAPTT